MEKSTTNTETTSSSLATYQCVVCQTTYVSLTDLHRHQSYRHTPEELSLSTIGLHFAAIKMFESPNGIVYDNSWLHDPSRHAEFYTYSSDMLCDDNNNGGIVDCTKKNRLLEDGCCLVADPANANRKKNKESFVNKKYTAMSYTTNESLVNVENFTKQESFIWEPTILDLTVKISSDSTKDSINVSRMQTDAAQDRFVDSIESLCDDIENMNRDPGKHQSSLSECPVPRKVRKVSAKKKLWSSKSEAKTQVTAETDRQTVEFKKQNIEKADHVEQELTFASQDSLSYFATDEKKNRLPTAKNKKYGACQKNPLNLTKVVKKTRKRGNTVVVGKSENQNCGKEAAVRRVSKFSLEHFLTYLKDEQKQLNVESAENLVKQDAFGKKKNIEEIQAENLANEKTARDTGISSSKNNGNKDSVEYRSIFDPEESASSSHRKEDKIHTQLEANAAKPIVTTEKAKILETVTDNPDAETQKPSNQYFTNKHLEDRTIFDSDVPVFSSEPKEDKIDTEPPVDAIKSIASRKQTKRSKSQSNKSAKREIIQKNFAKENSGIDHSSIFNSANFSSHIKGQEKKGRKLTAVNAKKRAVPKTRAKNPKIVADKLPKQETSLEINDPVNQDHRNDNSAKENPSAIHDVYSYIDNDSDEETIATLSEFRAKKSISFQKKSTNENIGDKKYSTYTSSTEFSSNKTKIDELPIEKTKKPPFLRKKSINSRIASATPIAKETDEEIAKLCLQDCEYGNSVEQNSIAMPDAYFHANSAEEKVTIDTLRVENVEKSGAFAMQTEDTEIATDDPAMRAAQEIDALFNEVYDNENSVVNHSLSISDVYFFAHNANEEPAIEIQFSPNLKSPKVVATDSDKTIEDSESQRCENVNFLEQNSSFAIDYCPANSESHSSSRTSAVSFVAYPPGLDERSVLVFDPKTSHLVWTTAELEDSQSDILPFDEMPRADVIDNDNYRDSTDIENISLSRNVDNETSNTSSMFAEINASMSDGDSSSQTSNRRSTRTKRAINRYVPQKT